MNKAEFVLTVVALCLLMCGIAAVVGVLIGGDE